MVKSWKSAEKNPGSSHSCFKEADSSTQDNPSVSQTQTPVQVWPRQPATQQSNPCSHRQYLKAHSIAVAEKAQGTLVVDHCWNACIAFNLNDPLHHRHLCEQRYDCSQKKGTMNNQIIHKISNIKNEQNKFVHAETKFLLMNKNGPVRINGSLQCWYRYLNFARKVSKTHLTKRIPGEAKFSTMTLLWHPVLTIDKFRYSL